AVATGPAPGGPLARAVLAAGHSRRGGAIARLVRGRGGIRIERIHGANAMRPLLFAVMLLCAVPSWAETAARQDAPEQTVTPKPPAPRPYEMPAGATLRRGQKPPEGLTPTEKQISSPTDEVDASDALDEMIDELASDLARLGSGHFAPILLERVRLSDNFNPQFAAILEARLATAIFQATSS